MERYTVSLEISGPTAMWTRPDTGDAPVSYPAPTFSAVKGIFESILYIDWAEVIPNKVEVCKPIVYHTYNTNYGGPLRKTESVKSGSSYQLLATVLVNVCYRLYATIQSDPDGYPRNGQTGKQGKTTSNGAHAYCEMFNRRLKRGQCFFIPFLGWKEFTPDYVGPFRSETTVCNSVNLQIPSMLHSCFPLGRASAWQPSYFDKPVKVIEGVLNYAQ